MSPKDDMELYKHALSLHATRLMFLFCIPLVVGMFFVWRLGEKLDTESLSACVIARENRNAVVRVNVSRLYDLGYRYDSRKNTVVATPTTTLEYWWQHPVEQEIRVDKIWAELSALPEVTCE